MESSTSRKQEFGQHQADLKRKIAQLQAQLDNTPQPPSTPPSSVRSKAAPSVIAPATPSPKKKKARTDPEASPSRCSKPEPPRPPLIAKQVSKKNSAKTETALPAFSLKSQLSTLDFSEESAKDRIARSEAFTQKPTISPELQTATRVQQRDDRLALVEDLELGPQEHEPPPEDPEFKKLEPNSGIRLKSRVLPHDALQDHLRGRYYLPPSLLYSVVRLLPNKQAYEVPVEGDWITIAVVAERGGIRFTSGPGNFHKQKTDDDTDETLADNKSIKKGSGKDKDKLPGRGDKRKRGVEDNAEENPRKGGKKFVHIRLVDLGTLSRTSSSSSVARASLRGDAQLNLLLFESDRYDKIIEIVEDQFGKKKERVTKIWRGGSGGAFEECFATLREGAVVALLNPNVLKPFQNPKNPAAASILALTPPSASAVAIIGFAQDLGMCTVRKRDGKVCGSWVDRRIANASGKTRGDDVCEYHVQNAVQHARSARPEFSIGTSGMSSTSHKRRKADNSDMYDPARQWGLKPDGPSRGAGGESTYIIGGYVANSASAPIAPGVTGETMGREGQARAKRKREDKESERALMTLLEKSAGGFVGSASMEGQAMEVVRRARAMNVKKDGKSNAVENGKEKSEEAIEGAGASKPKYSVEMVRSLGFDPTLLGKAPIKKSVSKDNELLLGALKPKEIKLCPPPGKKVRSGVQAPPQSTDCLKEPDESSDLEIEGPPRLRTGTDDDDDLYA